MWGSFSFITHTIFLLQCLKKNKKWPFSLHQTPAYFSDHCQPPSYSGIVNSSSGLKNNSAKFRTLLSKSKMNAIRLSHKDGFVQPSFLSIMASNRTHKRYQSWGKKVYVCESCLLAFTLLATPVLFRFFRGEKRHWKESQEWNISFYKKERGIIECHFAC